MCLYVFFSGVCGDGVVESEMCYVYWEEFFYK